MPYKDKEVRKVYHKQYHLEHKEKARKYMKDWYTKNKEIKKEYSNQYYIENKERLSEYKKKYNEENLQKNKEQCKKYYQNNIEKIKKYRKDNDKELKRKDKAYKDSHKKERREYQNHRYKTDLKFNLTDKIRRAISFSLKNNKNGRKWEDLVGYNCNDLIKHLKKTIPKGYNWNDFLTAKLHIDHIIPKSVFNFTKPEHTDFKRCWDLSNLRLLSARENLIKKDKLGKPFQASLKLSI